jgi:hypothetical protein
LAKMQALKDAKAGKKTEGEGAEAGEQKKKQ